MKLRAAATYLLALALLSACSPKEVQPAGAARVQMALASDQRTKAHFEDVDGTAGFIWDVGSEMLAVVSNGSAPVQWEGGEYCSPMHISLIDPAHSNRVLRACSEYTLAASAAKAGDPLFFLSPANGSALCSTQAGADGVQVEFAMPSVFEQSASAAMEEFEPYCYIRGESTIKSAPTATEKNFVANTTAFTAIPAIFRFNVSNNTEQEVVLESVKITCNKLFPDRLCWKADGVTVRICEPEDKSGYFNTVKTSVNWGHGNIIGTGGKGTYYSLCLPFDDDSSMDGATLAFILETSDKIYTFNIPAADFFRSSSAKRFESNKIYTFNFSLNGTSVELEGVSIADWMKDSFYLPIVDITADVKVNLSYWVQDRKNLYTYGFMKMFSGESPMWAECNLGEYLYSASDIDFNWNEVTPSDPADTDYLAVYYDNITDFKWKTPSRSDFEQLFSLPDSCLVMCRDEESGVHGLKIKSKDRPGASIFLPCSGRTEVDTVYPGDGSTVINRTFHGYYWTLDEAPSATNAYLLHFSFSQVETVVEDVSTFSEYSRVLNSGKLYEFMEKPKTDYFTVRAIL